MENNVVNGEKDSNIIGDTETDNLEMLVHVKGILAELGAQLEQELPNLGNALSELNLVLRKNPELTYLLSDDEIAPFYGAHLRRAFAFGENNVKKGKAKSKNPFNVKQVDKDGNSLLDLIDNM